MTLDAKALEPCPFCGGEAKSTYIRDGRQIACLPCGARGPSEFHGPSTMLPAEDRAINGWNRRAALPHAGKVSEEERERILEAVVAPDNGSVSEVLDAVLTCALAWVPEARIIGNVRAGDIARAVQAALSSQQAEAVPVGWAPQEHLDFLEYGRRENRPSSAVIHDRPNEEMRWTVPLYTSPSPADAGEPGIKALEWRQSKLNDSVVATHPFGENYVISFRDDCYRTIGRNFPSLKAAQSAAQADFDARIRSALVPATSQAKGGAEAKVWPEPGDKMQFLDENGYDGEREDARKVFTKGQVLTVKSINIRSFSHSIRFEEWPSRAWNGVMFALRSSSPVGQETAKDGE